MGRQGRMKIGIVLFNLGGPDSLAAAEPFLRNLFSDPAIIRLPVFLRLPLARWAAKRRAPKTRAIYAKLGGQSPLLANTEEQAARLEEAIAEKGYDAKVVIAMRYWRPFAAEALNRLKDWGAERLLLLPLYPHYSTTTTASSFRDWDETCRAARLRKPTKRICCYPLLKGFLRAHQEILFGALKTFPKSETPRILFSAHGLPERIVKRGDPYPKQILQSAAAIADGMNLKSLGLEWRIAYQSRVGPIRWIKPYLDDEIRQAGKERRSLLIAPLSFVSDHSETLVELDRDCRDLAKTSGVPHYARASVLAAHPFFVEGLAAEAARVLEGGGGGGGGGDAARLAPCGRLCGWREEAV